MLIVRTKFKLIGLSTDEFVYVASIRKVYMNVGGTWIERRNFSMTEAMSAIGIDEHTLRELMQRREIPTRRGGVIKLTFKEIRRLRNDYRKITEGRRSAVGAA